MGIRLMIADDHVAIGAGIVGLIQGTEIELVCQAETCEQTVKIALSCQPDVVLLDLRLQDSDGLVALEQIKRTNPKIAVLVFSAVEEVKEMAHARAGRRGIRVQGRVAGGAFEGHPPGCDGPERLDAAANSPGRQCAAAAALANHDRNPLSAREVEVLKGILDGLPNDGIAQVMEIDVETVKQHVKHILRKLHVEDRTQAALLALRNNMYDEPTVVEPEVRAQIGSPWAVAAIDCRG